MFVTFEGNDCSGKTTLIKIIADLILKKYNIKCITTKEPRNNLKSNISNLVASNLLNKSSPPTVEIFFFFISRYYNLQEIIIPNIKNNLVISDRFFDSTIVYQSINNTFLKNDSFNRIYDAAHSIFDDYLPDITFFIISSLESIKVRMKNKHVSLKNKYDYFDIDEFHKVAISKYEKLYEKEKKLKKRKVCRIDGNNDIVTNTKQIMEIISHDKEFIKLLK